MARNRKRAKERRARRPQPVVGGRPERDDPPGPIAHAAPDVELAEAQLALGRPELARDSDRAENSEGRADTELDGAAELTGDTEVAADDELEAELAGDSSSNARAAGEDLADDEQFGEGPEVPGVFPGRARVESGELEPVLERAPEARVRTGNRLVTFLQGSWRELQRVQWPDRRQVMQATGVVIGFVIVAGVFLGVADALAGKLMNSILK